MRLGCLRVLAVAPAPDFISFPGCRFQALDPGPRLQPQAQVQVQAPAPGPIEALGSSPGPGAPGSKPQAPGSSSPGPRLHDPRPQAPVRAPPGPRLHPRSSRRLQPQAPGQTLDPDPRPQAPAPRFPGSRFQVFQILGFCSRSLWPSFKTFRSTESVESIVVKDRPDLELWNLC